MRIGIDTFALTRNTMTGLGVYLSNLIKHLEPIDKDNEYFLYSGGNFTLPFTNNRWHIRPVKGMGAIKKLSTPWLVWGAREALLEDKIDVFLGTQNLVPIFSPQRTKKVLVINDLYLFVCPQTLPFMAYLVHKMIFKRSLLSAERIIAISNSTKNDIKKYFPDIEESKISLIYDGSPEGIFQQYDKRESEERVLEKLHIQNKYILAVASLEWRKNITGLLEAFHILKNRLNIEHKLLIVAGESRSYTNEIYRRHKKLGLANYAYFLKSIDREDLVYLYNGAAAFVFPSFYEGFGLPPLEAMACGTPVVASDIPVFKEVLNDAALLADPYNPEDIAQKIYTVISNEELRNNLIRKGFERIKIFSWERTASQTLNVFREIAGE